MRTQHDYRTALALVTDMQPLGPIWLYMLSTLLSVVVVIVACDADADCDQLTTLGPSKDNPLSLHPTTCDGRAADFS